MAARETENTKDPLRDHVDPTADIAISNADRDKRAHELLFDIFELCKGSGFRIEGRITLVHNRTGKQYK